MACSRQDKTKDNDELSTTETILSYCYICNAQIFTEKPKGWDLPTFEGNNKRTFQSVTCGSSTCTKRYNDGTVIQLPVYTAPYIATEAYDGGPFLEYAQRANRPEILDNAKNLESLVPQAFSFGNSHKLEPLFQSWLFFGLLQEFLGCDFHKEDFLTEDELLLTTRNLEYIVSSWIRNGKMMRQVETIGLVNLTACLRLVHYFLRMTIPFENLCSSFNKDLSQIIAFTAAMLESSLHKSFEEFQFWGHNPAFGHGFRKKRFDDLGWCPHEAYNIFAHSTSFFEVALYGEIERPISRGLHSQCTMDECIRLRSDPNKITIPLHSTSDCKCQVIGPNEYQLNQIRELLYQKKLPVIRLERQEPSGTIELDILEMSKSTPYVAISHVWASGLGNSSANQINRCQLEELFNELEALSHITHPRAQKRSVFLWLDTLCCPVTPESARLAAIQLLRKTYEEACQVLVLDSELQSLETEKAPVLEVAARIFISQWTRRLWTLQESTLPHELWFKCKDRIVNGHALMLALIGIQNGSDTMNYLIASGLVRRYLGLRLSGGGRYNKGNWNYIWESIGPSLQNRGVTMPYDEPLCIATLLDLDMERVFSVEKHDRMKMVWKMISEKDLLTRFIIFHGEKRMSEQGYRWAPSSFLQQKRGLMTYQVRQTNGPAHLTFEGLQFQSPGISFQVPGCPPGFDPDQWKLDAHTGLGCGRQLGDESGKAENFFMRDKDGKWLMLTWTKPYDPTRFDSYRGLWEIMSFSRAEYALIQLSPGPLYEAGRDRTSLIVRIESETTDIRCTPISLVGVGEVNSTWARLLETSTKIAEEVRKKHELNPDDNTAWPGEVDSSTQGLADEFKKFQDITTGANPWDIEKVRAFLESDTSLARDWIVIGGADRFVDMIDYALAGRYAVVKDYRPETQHWIVG